MPCAGNGMRPTRSKIPARVGVPPGIEVDDQIKLCRQPHRQVVGLGTLEDTASILADLTIRIRDAWTVAHEAATDDIFACPVDYRQLVVVCKLNDLRTATGEKPIVA